MPCGNDEVEFELKENQKGKYAANITLLKSASKKQDDRIICPQCKKKIIPRIQYLNNAPYVSHCPYCACTVKQFQSNSLMYMVSIFLLILFIFF